VALSAGALAWVLRVAWSLREGIARRARCGPDSRRYAMRIRPRTCSTTPRPSYYELFGVSGPTRAVHAQASGRLTKVTRGRRNVRRAVPAGRFHPLPRRPKPRRHTANARAERHRAQHAQKDGRGSRRPAPGQVHAPVQARGGRGCAWAMAGVRAAAPWCPAHMNAGFALPKDFVKGTSRRSARRRRPARASRCRRVTPRRPARCSGQGRRSRRGRPSRG